MGRLTGGLSALVLVILASPSLAATEQSPAVTVRIGYLAQKSDRHVPLSPLEPVVEDAGIQGARLAVKDNQTTGRFTGQRFLLDEVIVPTDGEKWTPRLGQCCK